MHLFTFENYFFRRHIAIKYHIFDQLQDCTKFASLKHFFSQHLFWKGYYTYLNTPISYNKKYIPRFCYLSVKSLHKFKEQNFFGLFPSKLMYWCAVQAAILYKQHSSNALFHRHFRWIIFYCGSMSAFDSFSWIIQWTCLTHLWIRHLVTLSRLEKIF